MSNVLGVKSGRKIHFLLTKAKVNEISDLILSSARATDIKGINFSHILGV